MKNNNMIKVTNKVIRYFKMIPSLFFNVEKTSSADFRPKFLSS